MKKMATWSFFITSHRGFSPKKYSKPGNQVQVTIEKAVKAKKFVF